MQGDWLSGPGGGLAQFQICQILQQGAVMFRGQQCLAVSNAKQGAGQTGVDGIDLREADGKPLGAGFDVPGNALDNEHQFQCFDVSLHQPVIEAQIAADLGVLQQIAG